MQSLGCVHHDGSDGAALWRRRVLLVSDEEQGGVVAETCPDVGDDAGGVSKNGLGDRNLVQCCPNERFGEPVGSEPSAVG